MNWKQTIGLVLAVGLAVALCFAIVFPALYESGKPETVVETKEKGISETEEERDVLPKLKGMSWKAPEKKAPEKKTPEKKPEKTPGAEKPAPASEEAVLRAVAPTPGQKPLLELQEMSWYEQGGYVVVVGSVKNISDRSIPSVRVHAVFQDENQKNISSEHSLIELNPIFPGQVSAFTITARFNPRTRDVVLDFRRFSGAKIPWSKLEVVEEEKEEAQEAVSEEAQPEGEAEPGTIQEPAQAGETETVGAPPEGELSPEPTEPAQ